MVVTKSTVKYMPNVIDDPFAKKDPVPKKKPERDVQRPKTSKVEAKAQKIERKDKGIDYKPIKPPVNQSSKPKLLERPKTSVAVQPKKVVKP